VGDVHSTSPLTIERIEAAAARIEGLVHRTPVLGSRSVDALCGAEVHMKAEHLQNTGSFKARGATNRVQLLSADELRRGIVAVSSGNHAAAVAWAGARAGTTVDVFMPTDAPELKRRATETYGARIHTFDRATADREQLGLDWAVEHGAVMVHPFEDHDVMAGQGTAALELHEDVELATLVVPVSGGGLIAGCAVATRARRPGCRIVGVEPAAADDTARSFAAGERVTVRPATIADGLTVPTPGANTFSINRRLVDEIVTVTEEQILAAMVVLYERTKQVVEPSGATALAAVLAGRVSSPGPVGVILSGGNIDLRRFAQLLT
jgi:threonine dehydratase